MSDREKEIIRKMAKTIPELHSDEQNYILGVAEGLAMAKEIDRMKPDEEKPAEQSAENMERRKHG